MSEPKHLTIRADEVRVGDVVTALPSYLRPIAEGARVAEVPDWPTDHNGARWLRFEPPVDSRLLLNFDVIEVIR